MSRCKALSLLLLLAVSACTIARADTFNATLLGTQEVPPNASFASGYITVTLTGDLLSVNLSFIFLEAAATAAHIHCCGPAGITEPVAIPFTGFPNAVSGTYASTFDLTNPAVYSSAFLTNNGGTAAGAEAALIAALKAGNAYSNIHDSIFPGGEIRGQLEPVPEPSSLVLLGTGLLGAIGAARRKLLG